MMDNQVLIPFREVKKMEAQLDDVMEILDVPLLKIKLKEVEEIFSNDPTELNKVRLGIIWHETALNLSFLKKTAYRGYAKKSFDILSELFDSPGTIRSMMPFISAYRASAMALMSSEQKKLKILSEAFVQFNHAVDSYGSISCYPEFLRGSVAENLPWFFFSKVKYSKLDFESIIRKTELNPEYANDKIMSFTYWAWAKGHRSKKYRTKVIEYLDKAIALDPGYMAGRKKAEALRAELL